MSSLDKYATHIPLLLEALLMMRAADASRPLMFVEHGNGGFSTPILNAVASAYGGKCYGISIDESWPTPKDGPLPEGLPSAAPIDILFVDGPLLGRKNVLRKLSGQSRMVICHDVEDAGYGWKVSSGRLLCGQVSLPILRLSDGPPATAICGGGAFLNG